MERVKKVFYKSKEIIFVDYSNVKQEDEMIAILNTHKEMVLKDNKKHLFCADYTGSFTQPRYMKEANRFLSDTKHLIFKGSFLGITGAKGVLLSSVTRLFGLKFRSFSDKNSALDFLIE